MKKLRLSPRWLLALVVVALTAVIWFPWHKVRGQAKGPAPAAKEEPPQPLPIRQVVLFNSGVGYFQREGEVDGNARIDLSFPASEINDLLKSLVLQDLGKGKISAVSYDSHEPVEKILRSFALDLTGNPSFGQILNQVRGEKVVISRLDREKKDVAKIAGTVVGLETRQKTVAASGGVASAEAEILNLTTPAGIQSVPLDEVVSVNFAKATLESEFQRALDVLARSHDVQKKSVTLGFDGVGKRQVRVGYVVERPIWKTSYRLRIDPGGKLVLQGWAHIDNPSDEDWKDVRLVLVSGKPISYQMDLYQPLYMPRPKVEPALFASLRPPVYAPPMDPAAPLAAGGPPASTGMFGMMGGFNLGGGGFNLGGGFNFGGGFNIGGGFQGAGFGGGSFPGGFNGGFNGFNTGGFGMNRYQMQEWMRIQAQDRLALSKLTYDDLRKRREALVEELGEGRKKGPAIAGLNFKEGIETVATAEEAGDYHQYVIDQKITLARQKSAMLPILDRTIEGAKVSIYNAKAHVRFPLLGLRVKNTSGLPLTQGPITVFDQSTYAGDTRMLDVQPNEERLLSYALDQTTEVKTTVQTSPGPEMNLKIGDSKLTSRFTLRETTRYAIKNRGDQDRTLIVEHPIRGGWKLVEPTKGETTRDHYRFTLIVRAGKTESLEVREETPRVDEAALLRTAALPHETSLGIAVKPVLKTGPEEVIALQIAKGQLKATARVRESLTYFVQNLSDMDRTFLVDHIIRPEWRLVGAGAAPDAKGPVVHRFTLTVPKGKALGQEIVEEKLTEQFQILAKVGPETLREHVKNPLLGAAVKAALAKLVSLDDNLAQTRKELADLEGDFARKSKDQQRMRDNLSIIPMSSDHYKKFLDRFVAQETELEGLTRQIAAAQATLSRQEQERRTLAETINAE